MIRHIIVGMKQMLAGTFLCLTLQVLAQTQRQDADKLVQNIGYAKPAHSQTTVVLRNVLFTGAYQLPVTETEKLAQELQSRKFHGSDWLREVEERARYFWQNHGYFKVELTANAKPLPDGSEVLQPYSTTVTVLNEGAQYRLGSIGFENIIANAANTLRKLFPLNDGEIFRAESIQKGLENLRRAYGEVGHLNFTAVPIPHVDDTRHLISLTLHCEEGKVFFVRSVKFTGIPTDLAATLASRFLLKRGDVFNARLLQVFFDDNVKLLPPGATVEHSSQLKIDNENQTVDISLNFAPATPSNQ